MQNLVAVSHAVCTHVGLKKLGGAGPRPLGRGVAEPWKRAVIRMCYRAKMWSLWLTPFGRRCALKKLFGHAWARPLGKRAWRTL